MTPPEMGGFGATCRFVTRQTVVSTAPLKVLMEPIPRARKLSAKLLVKAPQLVFRVIVFGSALYRFATRGQLSSIIDVYSVSYLYERHNGASTQGVSTR